MRCLPSQAAPSWARSEVVVIDDQAAFWAREGRTSTSAEMPSRSWSLPRWHPERRIKVARNYYLGRSSMSSCQKVSVSLRTEELRWIKAVARRSHLSVSSLVNDAIRLLREQRERERARQALRERFFSEDRPTETQMEEIRAEWQRG